MTANRRLLYVLLMESGKHLIDASILTVGVEFLILRNIQLELHFIKD
jgi:hypothetical protein